MGESEVEEHPDMGVVEPVEGAPTLAAHLYDPMGPQQTQGVTHRRLRLPACQGQVADAEFPREQGDEQAQAPGVAEKPEDVGSADYGFVWGHLLEHSPHPGGIHQGHIARTEIGDV